MPHQALPLSLSQPLGEVHAGKVSVCVCVRMYTHIYIYQYILRVHVYVWLQEGKAVRLPTVPKCIYACVCVCVVMCVFVWYMYMTYIYMYIYIYIDHGLQDRAAHIADKLI